MDKKTPFILIVAITISFLIFMASKKLRIILAPPASADVEVTEEAEARLSGVEVISLIEKLKEVQSDEKILVYTNGKTVCAEYTKFGPTKAVDIENSNKYVKKYPNVTSATGNTYYINQITCMTGNYRQPTDPTYINPQLVYDMYRIDATTIIIIQRVDQ